MLRLPVERCRTSLEISSSSTNTPHPARILAMHKRNVFAGPYLERAAHLRADPAWFDNALADERSRVLPVWNSRNLIADADPPGVVTPGIAAPRAALLDLAQIPAEQHNSNDLILLGRFNDTSFFA